MRNKYLNLTALVFNQPVLCTEDYAETVAVVLGDKLGINTEGLSAQGIPEREDRQMNIQGDGTLVIPILGAMTHRASFLDAASGIQSYSSIQAQIQEGLDNPQIKSILLEMDSPGGTVAGAFDLRDFIYSNRGKKPMYALARDSMNSAAYLIGSACDKVYSTQTGQLGSIGVIAMHLDKTKANEEAGVKPTFIYAGKYKNVGNPNEKMTKEGRDYLQESVDHSYDMFVKAVAEARGIDEDEVRATEARIYRGEKAIDVGLSDGIRTLENTLSELATSAPRVYDKMSMKGNVMDKEEIQKLEADLAEAQATAEKNKSYVEKLTAFILAEGYSITSEGIQKEPAKEMIEVDGEMFAVDDLPESIVKTLKATKEAKLEASAKETFPNLRPDVAKELIVAFQGKEEVLTALKGLDAVMAGKLEEVGESGVDADMSAPEDKLNALAKKYQSEQGVKFEQAYAAVAKTEAGQALLKEIYNKDN